MDIQGGRVLFSIQYCYPKGRWQRNSRNRQFDCRSLEYYPLANHRSSLLRAIVRVSSLRPGSSAFRRRIDLQAKRSSSGMAMKSKVDVTWLVSFELIFMIQRMSQLKWFGDLIVPIVNTNEHRSTCSSTRQSEQTSMTYRYEDDQRSDSSVSRKAFSNRPVFVSIR